VGFPFHSTGCVIRAKKCCNESRTINGPAPAAGREPATPRSYSGDAPAPLSGRRASDLQWPNLNLPLTMVTYL